MPTEKYGLPNDITLASPNNPPADINALAEAVETALASLITALGGVLAGSASPNNPIRIITGTVVIKANTSGAGTISLGKTVHAVHNVIAISGSVGTADRLAVGDETTTTTASFNIQAFKGTNPVPVNTNVRVNWAAIVS